MHIKIVPVHSLQKQVTAVGISRLQQTRLQILKTKSVSALIQFYTKLLAACMSGSLQQTAIMCPRSSLQDHLNYTNKIVDCMHVWSIVAIIHPKSPLQDTLLSSEFPRMSDCSLESAESNLTAVCACVWNHCRLPSCAPYHMSPYAMLSYHSAPADVWMWDIKSKAAIANRHMLSALPVSPTGSSFSTPVRLLVGPTTATNPIPAG